MAAVSPLDIYKIDYNEQEILSNGGRDGGRTRKISMSNGDWPPRRTRPLRLFYNNGSQEN